MRALIDGPNTGVSRQQINLKALQLTTFVIKCGPSARTATIQKGWQKADISAKWAETAWAKKLEAKTKRASMTDFDRFKLMKAKQARRAILRQFYGKAVKAVKAAAK